MDYGTRKMHKSILESKGRYFLLAALFASVASALALADSFRVYEAETTAIMLAKSDRAAVLLRSTVENAALLAGTDPYRTRFFEELSAKSGKFDELSVSSRRDTFESMVDVTADEHGSVLHVSGYADDPDDAKEISRIATLSLFRFLGQYYNVKEDVDFRITGGPTTVSMISDKPLFALYSVALGTLSASILFLILWALPRVFAFSGGHTVSRKPLIDAGVFEPSRPMSPYFDQTAIEEEPIPFPKEPSPAPAVPVSVPMPTPEPSPAPTREEPSSVHARKASAPVNLPALSEAEEQFLREFSFEGPLEKEDADLVRETALADIEAAPPAAEQEIPRGEPTEEEYKRRLNELLRG